MKREQENPFGWHNELLPLCIVLFAASLFFFSFFNRFAGLRSGDGEFGGGIGFLSGLMPYRDYFTAGPPLNLLKSAFVLSLFGKLLIVTRAMAVFERLAIAAALYIWLRRLFSRPASALGALTAIIISAGDHTDPLASYNHDAIFMAILCGLSANFSISLVSTKKALAWSATAGLFSAVSLLTKQTVGGFVLISVLAALSFATIRIHGSQRSVAVCATYFAGAFAPVAGVALFLWRLGCLRACLQMLFITGPKAKASHPLVFLSREIMIAGLFRWWVLCALIAILLLWAAIYRALQRQVNDNGWRAREWWFFALAGIGVCGSAWIAGWEKLPLPQGTGKSAVYFVLFGGVALLVAALQQAVHGPPEKRLRAFQLLLFTTVSLSVAVSLSLSFPAFEAMALPGLGLLLASAFDGLGAIGRRALLVACLALVCFQIAEKESVPFGFDLQDEPSVSSATARSSEPMLAGMRLPDTTVRFIGAVHSAVSSRAHGHETIFTYPEMGLLYSLSGRYPPTRTASHNIDVVEDSFARDEARRLLLSPPAVIIYAKPSEEDMHIAEVVWREGHPSGQRAIIAAVDKIVSGYDLLGSYQLMPQDKPIRIYAKPDHTLRPHP